MNLRYSALVISLYFIILHKNMYIFIIELIFQCLEETKNSINTALANDFNTAKAMRSLINLINVVNKMLHDPRVNIYLVANIDLLGYSQQRT